jgi:hypothetical protein
VHTKKGDIKVDDAEDAMAEEQGDVSCKEAAHRVTKEEDVGPLVFVRGQPGSVLVVVQAGEGKRRDGPCRKLITSDFEGKTGAVSGVYFCVDYMSIGEGE